MRCERRLDVAEQTSRPARLPAIMSDGQALFFVCPCCNGNGSVFLTIVDRGTSQERMDPCNHCFGFGRLPVPKWYREQKEGAP